MNPWGNELSKQYAPRSSRANLKISPYTYGSSVLGSSLHAYLPTNWGTNRTLVLAGIHGEEPETSSVLSYALRSLQPEYLSCAVVIAANPDGMAHGIRGNINNVDLNRNFPTDDWKVGVTTTRWEMDLPQDVELSTGDKPASEPEVSNLIRFIQEYNVEQIISIHAPMGCIDYEQASPWPLVAGLSTRLNLPLVKDIGYPCPGSMSTWATENNIRLVTIEVEDSLPISNIRQKYGPVIQELLQSNLA